MEIVNIIAGPIIGSVIGYGTNYIAVKMLFRPLKPVKIGNFILPFTPGIIPKRKEQLASALGKAISDKLLTKDDMKDMFLEDSVNNSIVDGICNAVMSEEIRNKKVKKTLEIYFEEGDYMASKERVEDFICDKIVDGLCEIDISELIAKEGSRAIKEKTAGTMLEMFVNDELIESIAAPIGAKIEKYILENGKEVSLPIISREINKIEEKNINDIFDKLKIKPEVIKSVVSQIYTKFINDNIGQIIEKFDIQSVVEQKVNEMNVLEIENLVLSVMKNELNAIVNLGALIGLILGILNIFV